jgi:hypothetical protein
VNIRKSLSNILGWSTKRKIVVFESDDWGSVRTRSLDDYNLMVKKGLDVADSNFTRFDKLESDYDLERLFDLLVSFKDFKGNHPVFTPMCIVANPDFDKIENNNFENYYYEPFTETAKKYIGSENIAELWIKGCNTKVFVPGFHGREHLNVKRWMNLLKTNNEGIKIAFNCQSIGASSFKGNAIPTYLAAFDIDNILDIVNLQKIIITGTSLFENVFGFKAEYFIASNSPEPKSLEFDLKNAGIKYLTRYKIQKYPIGADKFEFELNWLGRRNKLGQIVITRNSGFEPSATNINCGIENCLTEIESAFFWHKPAIISTHRVNYVSGLSQENADLGLSNLKSLIRQIIKKWPDVEFMNTIDLAKEIEENR